MVCIRRKCTEKNNMQDSSREIQYSQGKNPIRSYLHSFQYTHKRIRNIQQRIKIIFDTGEDEF